MDVTVLVNRWYVAAVDTGGEKVLYNGPDPVAAGVAAAEWRQANPDSFPPLIRHDYYARVE